MTQRTKFCAMACSIARTWSIVGEPWTPLVLRDLSLGITRFDDLCADLGIARSILADRLKTLERAGVVTKQAYQSANRIRHEYLLTPMGQEIVPLIVAIAQWGDRWLDDGKGPPIQFRHSCGALPQATIACDHCGQPLTADTITAQAGPGSQAGPGTYLADHLPTAPMDTTE